VNASLVARIRAYTEHDRAAAMQRTLNEIRALPQTTDPRPK